MADKKTARITVRIESWVGDALRELARKQARKPASVAALALRDMAIRAGHAPPDDEEGSVQ